MSVQHTYQHRILQENQKEESTCNLLRSRWQVLYFCVKEQYYNGIPLENINKPVKILNDLITKNGKSIKVSTMVLVCLRQLARLSSYLLTR